MPSDIEVDTDDVSTFEQNSSTAALAKKRVSRRGAGKSIIRAGFANGVDSSFESRDRDRERRRAERDAQQRGADAAEAERAAATRARAAADAMKAEEEAKARWEQRAARDAARAQRDREEATRRRNAAAREEAERAAAEREARARDDAARREQEQVHLERERYERESLKIARDQKEAERARRAREFEAREETEQRNIEEQRAQRQRRSAAERQRKRAILQRVHRERGALEAARSEVEHFARTMRKDIAEVSKTLSAATSAQRLDVQQLRHAFHTAESHSARRIDEHYSASVARQDEASELKRALAQSKRLHEQASNDVTAERNVISRLQQELAASQQISRQLREELDEKRLENDQLSHSFQSVQRKLSNEQEHLVDARAEEHRLERLVEASVDEKASLRAELRRCECAAAGTSDKLAEVRAELRRTNTQLARCQDATVGLRYEQGAVERGAVMWLMGSVAHPAITEWDDLVDDPTQSEVLHGGLQLSSVAATAALQCWRRLGSETSSPKLRQQRPASASSLSAGSSSYSNLLEDFGDCKEGSAASSQLDHLRRDAENSHATRASRGFVDHRSGDAEMQMLRKRVIDLRRQLDAEVRTVTEGAPAAPVADHEAAAAALVESIATSAVESLRGAPEEVILTRVAQLESALARLREHHTGSAASAKRMQAVNERLRGHVLTMVNDHATTRSASHAVRTLAIDTIEKQRQLAQTSRDATKAKLELHRETAEVTREELEAARSELVDLRSSALSVARNGDGASESTSALGRASKRRLEEKHRFAIGEAEHTLALANKRARESELREREIESAVDAANAHCVALQQHTADVEQQLEEAHAREQDAWDAVEMARREVEGERDHFIGAKHEHDRAVEAREIEHAAALREAEASPAKQLTQGIATVSLAKKWRAHAYSKQAIPASSNLHSRLEHYFDHVIHEPKGKKRITAIYNLFHSLSHD